MNKLFRDPKLCTDIGQKNTPLIHRASPEVFESRKAKLIALIAKETSVLNELTTELRELEERGARGINKNEEKEDKGNANEENKSEEDTEANNYENVEEKEVEVNEN